MSPTKVDGLVSHWDTTVGEAKFVLRVAGNAHDPRKRHVRDAVLRRLLLCQDKKRGLEVVDLANPNTGGTIARSTTPKSELAKTRWSI
jgi:hypothetical protein